MCEHPKDPIPLSRPSIGAREISEVVSTLESGRLAMGPRSQTFEQMMAERCQTDYAIAVSSGTAALHLIVRSLDLERGDEVLTTPYSFVASANVLLYEGLTPRFVDVRRADYNMDIDAAEASVSDQTRALLAVDVFGTPADWPRLSRLGEAHGMRLIDDACEGLGATIGDAPLGSWGDAAAFGFYPNKQITTGEGGCITTNNEQIADACRSMRNQGRATDAAMVHVRLGYNYRMNELSAAVGCAQLERWPTLATRRDTLASMYTDRLHALDEDIRTPATPDGCTRSWFVYVVELREQYTRSDRDAIIGDLGAAGIEAAPYFPTIHLQPYYQERFGLQRGAFPVAEYLADHTMAIPFFPDMTEEHVDRVVAGISAALRRCRSSKSKTVA